MERAAAAVADADLVFVDPDNGLRRTDHREPRHRTKAVKHTYYDELRAFTEHGQSIVAYHHADRTATVDVQAQRRMEEAAEETGIEPLAVVRASRGSTRLFLVLAQSEHRAHLEGRLARITAGPWGRELQVIRPGSPAHDEAVRPGWFVRTNRHVPGDNMKGLVGAWLGINPDLPGVAAQDRCSRERAGGT